jgi:hypothetical protein
MPRLSFCLWCAMLISEIIHRAFRKIGVAADGEALTADMASAGLSAFNEMIAGWQLQGIDFWLSPSGGPLANYPELEASAEFPMPPAFREGTIYSLAARLAPEYSAQISYNPDEFVRLMQANLVRVPTSTIDTGITRGTDSFRRRWAIQ